MAPCVISLLGASTLPSVITDCATHVIYSHLEITECGGGIL